MQTAIKCLSTDGFSQGEKGVTFHSWLSGGEREILCKVTMAAWTMCQQEHQAPRKALQEVENGKTEQCRAVVDPAAQLESELS